MERSQGPWPEQPAIQIEPGAREVGRGVEGGWENGNLEKKLERYVSSNKFLTLTIICHQRTQIAYQASSSHRFDVRQN